MTRIAEFHAAVLQNLPDLSLEEMLEWIGPSRSTLRSGLSFLKLEKGGARQMVPKPQLLRLFAGESIILDSTDGTETIPEATDVFAYIDPNFEVWGFNQKTEPAKKIECLVYQQEKNGTFADNWGSLNWPKKDLCVTGHQVIEFCRKHRTKLRTESYGTFFLLERAEGQFFVASVRVRHGGRLGVYIGPFSRGRVWSAEYRHRFVVPQLVTQTISF